MLDDKTIQDLIKDLEHYKTSLDELKFAEEYLGYYGYLQPNATKEEFEAAVTEFQDRFNIETDGKLGPETSAAMSVPRCAVKDVHKLVEFASWRKDHLTYYINGYVGGLDKSTQSQIIKTAWGFWENVCDIHIEQVNSTKADIIIGVGQGARDQFDGPSGTLAWAELPSGRDRQLIMKFDLGENWVDNPRNRGILMLNVACHEFGHLLGLDHSKKSGALMAPFYSPNISKPQDNDDIPRIQAYYGKPVNNTPNPTTPPVNPNPNPIPSPEPNRLVLELEGSFSVKQLSIPGFRITKME